MPPSPSSILHTPPVHSSSSNRGQLVMQRLGHMRSSVQVIFFPRNGQPQMDMDSSLPLMIAGIACLALAIIGRLSKKIHNTTCYVIGSIGVLLINALWKSQTIDMLESFRKSCSSSNSV